MQDWSLTLCTLQDLSDDCGSLGDSSDEGDSEGSFSEGEWRKMMGEEPIVLDGSEGDDLPQTAEPLEGLPTGSYQELSEHCSRTHLHGCTGSGLLLPPQTAKGRGSDSWQLLVKLSSTPQRLLAPASCRLSHNIAVACFANVRLSQCALWLQL